MNQIDDHVKVRQRKSNRSTQDGDWQESGKRNKKRQKQKFIWTQIGSFGADQKLHKSCHSRP